MSWREAPSQKPGGDQAIVGASPGPEGTVEGHVSPGDRLPPRVLVSISGPGGGWAQSATEEWAGLGPPPPKGLRGQLALRLLILAPGALLIGVECICWPVTLLSLHTALVTILVTVAPGRQDSGPGQVGVGTLACMGVRHHLGERSRRGEGRRQAR